MKTPPRYLYSAPSADPALCLEERGGATGIGGKREGIGEEEEEEDEGPKAGSSWQIVAQSRSAQARRCEGGVKTAPRYLYSAPSADPALWLEGRRGDNGDWRQEGEARGGGSGSGRGAIGGLFVTDRRKITVCSSPVVRGR